MSRVSADRINQGLANFVWHCACVLCGMELIYCLVSELDSYVS